MVQSGLFEQPSAEPLCVGYGQAAITPEVGVCLAGTVSRRGRRCHHVRDPLLARALALSTPGGAAMLVTVDLLLITRALHAAVAERSGTPPDALLLSATHTHSGPGHYWDVGRGELFMGRYDERAFDRLATGIAAAIDAARAALGPAEARAAAAEVTGVSANRRQLHGPVDPTLQLVRFEPARGKAVSVVSFGAHPVVGCERAPHTCSADFPGELCRRLERRGERALFFTGAVGGLSPLFPEFPLSLDAHLTLLGDLLERGVEEAEQRLVPVASGPLQAGAVPVALPEPRCDIFPQRGAAFAVAEAVTTPLRRYLRDMGAAARQADRTALAWIRLGDAAWLGTPCDLGVNVALELQQVMGRHGIRHPFVGSQCGDYVGYVHLPADYRRVPEPGYRHMALYENAMSLSGHDMGRRFVAAWDQHLSREPAACESDRGPKRGGPHEGQSP